MNNTSTLKRTASGQFKKPWPTPSKGEAERLLGRLDAIIRGVEPLCEAIAKYLDVDVIDVTDEGREGWIICIFSL